jgi:hypothetical protein
MPILKFGDHSKDNFDKWTEDEFGNRNKCDESEIHRLWLIWVNTPNCAGFQPDKVYNIFKFKEPVE